MEEDISDLDVVVGTGLLSGRGVNGRRCWRLLEKRGCVMVGGGDRCGWGGVDGCSC